MRATHTSSDYSQVRSREKQLAKLETREVAAPTAQRAPIALRLDASRRGRGGFAFEAEGLSKSYARPLFEGLTLEVERGERLAVVGPNGSGKSTFLKIVGGELASDRGSVRFNPAAKVAYFAQNAHDQLDVERTAVQEVIDRGGVNAERARGLLGRMRISGDAADNAVRSFSGGERRRIMLACLMARSADVLLLDEPTNDLDIESREALESVLEEYEGAIVAVSHDRYFLSRLCDRVLWIDGGAWGEIEGGYDAYEGVQRARERELLEARNAPSRAKTTQLTPLKIKSQMETQIARVEREIAKLDERKAEIDRLFADSALYDDRARVAALLEEQAQVAQRGRCRAGRMAAPHRAVRRTDLRHTVIGLSMHEGLGEKLFALNEPYIRGALAGPNASATKPTARRDQARARHPRRSAINATSRSCSWTSIPSSRSSTRSSCRSNFAER